VKRFPAYLALLVVLLSLLGAFLHPLALALSLAPMPTHGFVGFLQELRTTIANLLGWALLGLLIAMLAYVVRGRLVDNTSATRLANYFPKPGPMEANQSVQPRVAVAITAYNDAEATAQAVRDYRRQPGVIRVLVIDNNSTDNTAELASAAGATVIHESRQGYGFACIRGLTEGLKVPDADVIALTEGDGTFVAEDTAKFLTYMDHADLVVGNRMVRGLVEPDSQMDHFFTWGNMAVAMLVRLRAWDGRFLGPAGLTDVGCTFRVIRRDALERILPDLTVGRNHFSPHMILVALSQGLSVIEIPIRFRQRVGESKGASRSIWSGLEVGAAMIWHIVSYRSGPAHGKPGVVVERDGLIIRQRQNGSETPTQVEFVPGAAEGLAALSRGGHRVVVIGDTSLHHRAGISRRLARAIDARIASEVEHQGGHIDGFEVCPHNGARSCSCRNPRPRLLLNVARRSPLDLARAVVVSDRPHFLEAAEGLGCRTILVGKGSGTVLSESRSGAYADDLAGAVELLLGAHSSSTPITPDLQAIT
jgi:histidinol-phosphate phosphatase family protein